MPNAMAALSNIGGALCSTPQSLDDAHYYTAVQQRCQDAKSDEICKGAPNSQTDLSCYSAKVHPIVRTCRGARYCCLTSFFPIVDKCLSCEHMARQSCAIVPRWRFLRPVFAASRVQRISDLHSKFALRPHHVPKYGKHLISDR